MLTPGARYSLSWTRGGKPWGDITLCPSDDSVTLSYRVRVGEKPWQDVSYDVPLEWTSCNYGGLRAWFRCPGVVKGMPCGRRVAILYDGGVYFLCRHCYDLAYQSQREDDGDRAREKTQAIRRRLGGTGNLLEWFPDKPKGMHWRTYNRLSREANQAEAIHDAAMEAQMIVMGAWIQKRHGDVLDRAGESTA